MSAFMYLLIGPRKAAAASPGSGRQHIENAIMTRPLPGCPAARQASRYWPTSSAILAPAMAMTMIEKPALPAATNDSGVLNAATQSGGVGFCVGRGNDVTARNEWNRPS